MDKLKMHSPSFVNQNIEKLAELFPNCVTESRDSNGEISRAIDFDLLKQELSENIVDGPQERYQINWPGKRDSVLLANSPTTKTLRPITDKSVNFENTKNLFIEGDNLDALKLLQETYLSKVKMIYIDPPYNTGNDFLYNDDFTESVDSFQERSEERDEEGNRLVANTEANGRFHSDWMSMIYPRIKLARNLLKDDGAIFISLDDNEIDNLRKICDEIFGAENFITTIIWQKVYAPKNSARHFSEDHDYIVVYAKDAELWKPNQLERTAEQDAHYKNPDDDERGVWMSDNLTARNFYADGSYEVSGPTGMIFTPPKGAYWRISEAKFRELDKDNRIWWGAKRDGMPRLKRFLTEVSGGRVPQTLWPYKEVGHTQEAKKELLEYVDFEHTENVLNSVKPSRLLQRIVKIATDSSDESIALDFFAGSGPLAHAVVNQNNEDGGNRKYIVVQIAEKLKKEEELKTISDLTRSRLNNLKRKVEIEGGNKGLDLGYRFFSIDESNMSDVYYRPDLVSQDDLFSNIDNVKEGRSDEDLLFQVMLDWGVDLSLPIKSESIFGKKVFYVDENALIACFDSKGEITEELVKSLCLSEPLRVVFCDNGFSGDDVKINVEQIFKQLSPHTDVKTI